MNNVKKTPILEIIQRLNSSNDDVRHQAVNDICFDSDDGNVIDNTLMPALVDRLRDKKERADTKSLILHIFSDCEEKEDPKHAVFTTLKYLAIHDSSHDVRELAIIYLADSNDDAIDELKKILNDPNKVLRITAMRSLKSFNPEKVLNDMILAYQQETDKETKVEMLEEVANTREPQALLVLADALHEEPMMDDALDSLSYNFSLDKMIKHDSFTMAEKKCVATIVDKLITIIKEDPNPVRRKKAVDCFQYASCGEAAIIYALNDENADVRSLAIDCLETLKKSSSAVKPLLDLYTSSNDIKTKKSIIRTLGSIKDPAAFTVLTQTLKNNSSSDLRSEAAEALSATWGSQVIAPLCEALDDETDDIRVTAVENLGDLYVYCSEPIEDADYSKILIKLSSMCEHETSDEVKIAAIDALGSLCGHLRPQEEDSDAAPLSSTLNSHIDTAINILIILLDNDDIDIKSNAIDALGGTVLTPFLDRLVIELKNPDSDIQKATAKALRYNKDTRILPELVHYLTDTSHNPNIRSKIAKAIGYLGNNQATTALINALQSKSTADKKSEQIVREGIVYGLRHYTCDAAVLALVEALEDKSADVREEAALSLGAMNDQSAIDPLMSLFNHKKSGPKTRRRAVMALGSIDHDSIPGLVEKALGDTNVHVRETAEGILASLKKGDRTDFYRRGTLHYE